MTELTKERQPWDQMQGEPDEHYVGFLAYRNLGPGRSVAAAYALTVRKRLKKSKPKAASGEWSKACTQWNWPERAAKWDIATLSAAGWKVVALFTAALEAYARKVVAVLQEENIRPKGWKGATEAMSVLSSFIPPETFSAICANPGIVGAAGVGSDPDARPGIPAEAERQRAPGVDRKP